MASPNSPKTQSFDNYRGVLQRLGGVVGNNRSGNGITSPEAFRSADSSGVGNFIRDIEVDDIIGNNELVYRINATIPRQATKLMPQFAGLSKLKQKRIEAQLRRTWLERMKTASYLANRYGSSFIYLDIDDGLDDNRPIKGECQITNSTILTAEHCRPASTDMVHHYDDPELWNVSYDSLSTQVHTSRILKFWGKKRYGRDWQLASYQHETYWLGCFNSLLNFLEANSAALTMLTDASVGVFKYGGLRDLMSQGISCDEADEISTNTIFNRLSALVDGVTIAKKFIIDKDSEEYEYVERNYTGVHEILNDFRQTFLGISPLPASVLFSNAESGGLFSEAGVGDRALLAHLVSEYQNEQMTPALYQLLSVWLGNASEDVIVTYPSTMSLTSSESAKTLFDLSKSLTSLVVAQIMTPQQAARRLSGEQLPVTINMSEDELAQIPATIQKQVTNNQGSNSNSAGRSTTNKAPKKPSN
jgi:hypothetical protein